MTDISKFDIPNSKPIYWITYETCAHIRPSFAGSPFCEARHERSEETQQSVVTCYRRTSGEFWSGSRFAGSAEPVRIDLLDFGANGLRFHDPYSPNIVESRVLGTLVRNGESFAAPRLLS